MYARLISETRIDTAAPRSAVIDGSTVCGQLPEDYLNSIGWYRLEETPAPEPREGYHYEARYAYDSDEAPTAIVQSWVEVQDPPPAPRVFSKLKIIEKADELGLATELIEMLRGNALLYEKWSAAVNLREDYASFASGLALVKQATGLTDEQIAGILAASVAD